METLKLENGLSRQKVKAETPGHWIPVSKSLPKRNVPLFLYEGNVSKKFSSGYYEEQWLDNEVHGDGVFYCTNKSVFHQPTHWMYAFPPVKDGS